MIFKELRCSCAYCLCADRSCADLRVLIVRVLLYGSCRAIREFAWRVDRPLVDSAGNGRPHRGRRQSAFLPGFSGTMPVGVGSRLARLWSVSLGSRRWRIARRVEVDGGIRAGRLCAGDDVIWGGGADVGTGAAGADGVGRGFVGADGVGRDAATVFSGFEGPRSGVGSIMPADCGRSRRRTAAVPVRAYWTGAFPLRRRAADVASELAEVHQPYSERRLPVRGSPVRFEHPADGA